MQGTALRSRVALVLVVLVALGLAYYFGVFDKVRDPKELARTLFDAGAWGYLAFIVAYTFLQPFGVPGTVFIVAAPLIWPWPIAFALSMVGTMCASVVGFTFARFVARDWIAARIPERFLKYERALEEKAFRTVFTLRLIFWMPQVLHSFLGVSKVPFWTHFWGSFLGYIPPLLLVSYLGTQIFDVNGVLQPGAWKWMAALALASLTLVLGLRWYDRSKERATRLEQGAKLSGRSGA